MAILNFLRTYGIFNDHLVQFVFTWYIFSGFGIMRQEKSGIPGLRLSTSSPAKKRECKNLMY
jgi:hypothetical protein